MYAVVYTDANNGTVRVVSGLVLPLKMVVMPGFCLVSGSLSPPSLDRRRVRNLVQAFVVFMLMQQAYHFNAYLNYRHDKMVFLPLPLPFFQPREQVESVLVLLLLAAKRSC